MANINSIPALIPFITQQVCLPGNVVLDSRGNPVLNPDGSYKTSGVEQLDPGPASAKTQTIPASVQVPKSFLVSYANPAPPGGIDRLSPLQVKATMTMLGKALSGFSYTLLNGSNQIGKYQFNATMLYNLGYLKLSHVDAYSDNAIKYTDAWTGKDGIINLNTWFLSTGVQETAMYNLMTINYNYMTQSHVIKSDDNLCTRAGMLCVAHILGIDKTGEWRKTGQGLDIVGNSGSYFFALGRYAVDVLAYLTI